MELYAGAPIARTVRDQSRRAARRTTAEVNRDKFSSVPGFSVDAHRQLRAMRLPSVFPFFLAAALLWPGAVTAEDLNFVLLHTNDMHSRFDETDVYCNECREDDAALGKCYGGIARIAETVREEKRMAAARGLPALFMVAGDTFQGTPYFSLFKWQPCVDFIKELKPDIMVIKVDHE